MTMNPHDVPHDLIALAVDAAYQHHIRTIRGGREICTCGAEFDAGPTRSRDWELHFARVSLAAVLPVRDATVRATIAEEFLARARTISAMKDGVTDPVLDWTGSRLATNGIYHELSGVIARGPQSAPTASTTPATTTPDIAPWLNEILHVAWAFALREHEGRAPQLAPAHARLALERVPAPILAAASITGVTGTPPDLQPPHRDPLRPQDVPDTWVRTAWEAAALHADSPGTPLFVLRHALAAVIPIIRAEARVQLNREVESLRSSWLAETAHRQPPINVPELMKSTKALVRARRTGQEEMAAEVVEFATAAHRRAEEATAERDRLAAVIAQHRDYLDRNFRQWCSPYGVAADYATKLIAQLDSTLARTAPDDTGPARTYPDPPGPDRTTPDEPAPDIE